MKKLLIALGIIGTAASTYVVTNAAIKGGSVKGVMHALSGSLRSTISFLFTPAWTGLPTPDSPAYIHQRPTFTGLAAVPDSDANQGDRTSA